MPSTTSISMATTPKLEPSKVLLTIAADGTQRLASTLPLQPYDDHMGKRLEFWARTTPDQPFVAQRDSFGRWQTITYRQMLTQARSIGQAFLSRGLSAEKPVVIVSENSLDHLVISMGAMLVGIPWAPLSAAYALHTSGHERLRHMFDTLTPGLVFASNERYLSSISACLTSETELVLSRASHSDGVTQLSDLLNTFPTTEVDIAQAGIKADTIAKFLFTSGSTKLPKAVVNTHRMWCSNQQMLKQCLQLSNDIKPVLVDWLPWSHTFGGNHNVGLVLYNGGTLYIDEGTPTQQGMAQTLQNLREVSPTHYFNVPKGFEELAIALERDEVLADSLFRHLALFMYAGAGLPQPVWDRLDAAALKSKGALVPMATSLGMTETGPACTFAMGAHLKAGELGSPCPGVEIKLVPHSDKFEIRYRGPQIMPGYWRAPELTAEAFDEEGYLRTGDAVKLIDISSPELGLQFDGRIAEDFKLTTGTFVSTGPLRARVIAAGAPYIQDVTVTGLNRSEVGLIVFPQLTACRLLAGLDVDALIQTVLDHEAIRNFFQGLAQHLWDEGGGSAGRVARFIVVHEPPSLQAGELTDKGSLNHANVLRHRAADIEALYGGSELSTGGFIVMPAIGLQ
jgi:feruloyl-CoA synthase